MARQIYPRTPDGRYFVVRGRLWRLANPGLPPALEQSLTIELMQARRAVRAAKDDSAKVASARMAVDRAKRALGERGPVWWLDGAPDYNRHMAANTPYADWYAATVTSVAVSEPHAFDDAVIEKEILARLMLRSARASICPSEVARALAPNDEAVWRALMPQVLNVVVKLANSGRVRITRGTQTLAPDTLGGGPIRIRRGARFDS